MTFFSVHPSTKSIEHRCRSRVFSLSNCGMLLRSWPLITHVIVVVVVVVFPGSPVGNEDGQMLCDYQGFCSLGIMSYELRIVCGCGTALWLCCREKLKKYLQCFSGGCFSLPVRLHPSVLTLFVLCFPYHLSVCVCVCVAAVRVEEEEEEGEQARPPAWGWRG